MKKQFSIFLFSMLALFIFANKAIAITPTITSISPDIFYADGAYNTYPTIYGENFMPFQHPNSKLIVNGVVRIVDSATLWQYGHISFSAPDSSGYVQVINSNGEMSDKFYFTVYCSSNSYSCDAWSSCSSSGTQTRTCDKINNCEDSDLSPATTQSCTPTCTLDHWSCTDWGSCLSGGLQYRECNKISNCQGGVSSPATSQSCTYIPACTTYSWSCESWSTCSSNGTKTRECNKISNCEGGTL